MKAILTYHSIERSGSPISIAPDTFDAHRRWLAGGNVRVLTLADLIAHPADGADAVAVTFDDGFLNVREPVERLLADGVPAAIFVVSGHVGKTNAWGGRSQPGIPTLPLLDWPDLEHLLGRGASLESHTGTHPSMPSLKPDAWDAELEGCRDTLRARLGVSSEHVAYPYGDVNDAVAARASRVFRFGHTTDFRVCRTAEEAMRLPRLDMYYFQTRGAIEGWGTPRFTRRLAWIRMRRMVRARLLPR